MSMRYPQGFTERVMEEYPEREDVTAALLEGGHGLGKLLREGSVRQMAPEDVVRCFHEGSEADVLRDAHAVIRRRALHAEWMRMMVRRIEGIDPPSSAGPRSVRRPNGAARAHDRAAPARAAMSKA